MKDLSNEPVKDVVCGMIKPKNQFKFLSVYDEETYYFCSAWDKELFDALPSKWILKESVNKKS